jgi:galactokinase
MSLTLGDLASSAERVVQRLESAGFEESRTARQVQTMFRASAERLLKCQSAAASSTPAKAFWVPGRIEVLGKHTDYAGGCSLLGAVSKGFAVVTTARDDGKCCIFTQFSDGREMQEELELTGETAELERLRVCETDEGGWAAYPAAAIQRLVSNFGVARGANISIECSLPEASGMSSSSAVICYMWMVLDAYNAISKEGANATFERSMGVAGSPERSANLFSFLGNIENGQDFRPGQEGCTLPGMGGVGTFGGSEDHTAIMSCSPGKLEMWSYSPTLHIRSVAVDTAVRFVIAVSGAKAEKTGGAMEEYNDAALLASWAAAAYAQARYEASMGGAGGAPPPRLSRDALAALFPGVSLFNPWVPNLAECVRCERLTHPELTPAQLRESTIRAIRSVGGTFKAGLGAMFGVGGEGNAPSLLKLDGLESERISIETLVTRFEQFYDESEVILPAAAEAFAMREYEELGRLVDESHRLTVEKLGNTIPETAWLPRWARGQEPSPAADADADGGAGGRIRSLAASAFGAGFGGSCWALVRESDAEAFRAQWRAAYEAAFPPKLGALERDFFVMSPGPGAFEL